MYGGSPSSCIPVEATDKSRETTFVLTKLYSQAIELACNGSPSDHVLVE